MKRDRDFSLKIKSVFAVSGLLLTLGALNTITFILLRGYMADLSQMIDVTVATNNLKSLAGKATEGLPADIEEYSLHPTQENKAKIQSSFDAIQVGLADLDHATLDPTVRTQFELVRNMFQTCAENYEEIVKKVATKAPFSQINELVANVKESGALIGDSIQQMISAELSHDQVSKIKLARQADINGLLLLLAIFATSIMGFVLFYTYLMKRNILRPLDSMQHTMGLIASDASDIKLRIKIERLDEIGILAEHFNKMADTIQQYKEHLEELVETRTEQLTKAQAMLVQSGKLSALGEMAGGVAHEVNNPLAVIQIKSSQLLELVTEDPIDLNLVKTFIQDIGSTVDRIAKIVKGLRSFSRDATDDPRQTVQLATVIEDTLALCSEKLKSHGVDLRQISAAAEVPLKCRPTEISQVLLNLINNSFDAISKETGGWIELQTHLNGAMLEIWITDSGKGISEATAQKVFQPFFTTKEIGKGTGLGLSISKGIIEAHGGRIQIDQQFPNTRFVIRLPMG